MFSARDEAQDHQPPHGTRTCVAARRGVWLGFVLGMFWFLSSLPTTLAEASVAGVGGNEPEKATLEVLAPEALVREVYARHERQVTASGTPLTIEISNVRVIPASEFGKVRLRDVVTLRPSHLVAVDVSTFSFNGRDVGISFPAHWIANSAGPEGEEAFDPTLEEAAQIEARELAREAQVPEAIVAFDSRITLDNRTVSYKAYFLLPEYRPGEPIGEFRFNDRVLIIAPELLAEERTARPEAELREITLPPEAPSGSAGE